MIPVISVENMRNSDRHTIESGTDSKLLMYRAAFGIYKSGTWKGNIRIAVGSGNNGGDGFALACILAKEGIASKLIVVGSKRTEDASFYEEIADTMPLIQKELFQPASDQFLDADVVVDCLLGTGFHGELRSPYREAIQEINDSPARIISADINSGLNGDTGEAELAVRSQITATIGFLKRGLLTGQCRKYIQKIVCIDIGIQLDRKEWELEQTDGSLGNETGIPLPEGIELEMLDCSGIQNASLSFEFCL